MKQDLELKCVGGKYNDGCGNSFTFTIGEQEFYEDLKRDGKIQELSNPKYCPDCRAKRKAKKEANNH